MSIPLNTLVNLPQFLLDDERYKSLEADEPLAEGDWIEWTYGAASTIDEPTNVLIGTRVDALPQVMNNHPTINGPQPARAWRALTESEITSAVLNNKWRVMEQDFLGFA